MWVRWGWLSQTSPIPRSPDGDNKWRRDTFVLEEKKKRVKKRGKYLERQFFFCGGIGKGGKNLEMANI